MDPNALVNVSSCLSLAQEKAADSTMRSMQVSDTGKRRRTKLLGKHRLGFASDVIENIMSEIGKAARYGCIDFSKNEEATAQMDRLEQAASQVHWEEWTADYEVFKATVKVHAIHVAAYSRSIHVMQWLMEKCGDDIKDRQARLTLDPNTPEDRWTPHYTPIMSATMGHVEGDVRAITWLLERGVDVNLQNADGMTACHVFAWAGLHWPRVDECTMHENLETIADLLVKQKADLNVRCYSLLHRMNRKGKHLDDEAVHIAKKTPLEIAAWSPTFPSSKLYILSKTHHDKQSRELLSELNRVALAFPTAVDAFLDSFSDQDHGVLSDRLRDEIKSLGENAPIEKFMNIWIRSPFAGAKLLEKLMCKPHVSDKSRHSLPSHALLPNQRMICTYQSDKEWEDQSQDQTKWHWVFCPDLENEPRGLFNRSYEVEVKTLCLPGILQRRVLFLLSSLPRREHLKLFSQIPVSGIVTCSWDLMFKVTCFKFIWELCLLFVFLSLAIWRPDDLPITCQVVHSLVVGEVILLSLSIIAGLTWWHRLIGWNGQEEGLDWSFLPSSALRKCLKIQDLTSIVVLVVYLTTCDITVNELQAYDKVVLASIVMMWCFRLFCLLRVVPVVGPLSLAVVHSLNPMLGMFALMGTIFTAFFSLFIILRDESRSFVFIFLYLYEMLILSDGDAAATISGVDIAKEQTADFGQEVYTGGGHPYLLQVSALFAVFGISLFSLVLLNLTIGMYTSYYEGMEPLANLLFEQGRARHCLHCMIDPAWMMAARLQRFGSVGSFLLASISFALYAHAVARNATTYITSLLLAILATSVQTLFIVATGLGDIIDDDERGEKRTLWICYRADYNEEYYNMCRQDDYEFSQLQNSFAKSQDANRSNLEDLAKQLDGMDNDVDALGKQIVKTNENVDELLARLKVLAGGPSSQVHAG